jgi:hypothetical protein
VDEGTAEGPPGHSARFEAITGDGNACPGCNAASEVKRIGFLSFGHWAPGRGSLVPTAADALQQTLELAVAAEEVGADGAFVRVHHFARQLA